MAPTSTFIRSLKKIPQKADPYYHENNEKVFVHIPSSAIPCKTVPDKAEHGLPGNPYTIFWSFTRKKGVDRFREKPPCNERQGGGYEIRAAGPSPMEAAALSL